ncbi:MAG: CPBP family intramembrane metalloprotease [Bacteroidales bacterium]|nr:CPBP family intramembrane metalloprotease [Bacteroidales bacterium]
MAVGGLAMGALIAVIYGMAGVAIADANPLLMYVAQFIPPFIYLLYKAGETVRMNGTLMEKGLFNRIVEPVPLNRFNHGKISPVVAVASVAIATISLMFILEPVNSLVPMPDSVKHLYEQMFSNMFWTTASVVVAAPLAEEFLLRGVILRGMLYHSTPLKAILWSSFYFAFIHMNLYQALGAFLMGLFLGWIYYRTGALWLTIFVHFINNGTSMLFTVLNPQIDIETTLMDIIVESWSVEAYIALFSLMLALFAFIIYYLNKNLGYAEIKKNISPSI